MEAQSTEEELLAVEEEEVATPQSRARLRSGRS